MMVAPKTLARVRSTAASPALRLLLLLPLVVAGAAPLAAQQPTGTVPMTSRRAPRLTGDPEGRLERLKLRADSLARMYGDDDGLSLAERQRVGDDLDRTVDELERLLAAVHDGMLRAGASFRMQMAPMADAQAREAMSRTLMQRASNGGMAPRGWVGFVAIGVAREPWVEDGQLFVHYVTYPEIVSVEPGSPAQQAGIVPGDTLIAYDGHDVRDKDISMTRLLVPNSRVLVRISRDGRMRDVPVRVADAPSRILLRRDDMNGTMSIARDPVAIGSATRFPRPASVGAPPAPPSAMRRPFAPTAPLPALLPGANTGVAGAQMASITPDWARLTGVSSGVLVMRVPTGSPAAESGLRDADVIVKAGGQTVRTLPELRDLIASAWGTGARALAIEYVRERKTRAGQLRW